MTKTIEEQTSIREHIENEIINTFKRQCEMYNIVIDDSDSETMEDIQYELDPILFKFIRRKVNG